MINEVSKVRGGMSAGLVSALEKTFSVRGSVLGIWAGMYSRLLCFVLFWFGLFRAYTRETLGEFLLSTGGLLCILAIAGVGRVAPLPFNTIGSYHRDVRRRRNSPLL